MYEMYNKDGSFRCYRIQRTVKDLNNNKKKIYAYSKTSLKDCKIKMNKMLAANQLAHKEKQKRLESKYNFDQYALNYYELYIKNANLSKAYKISWKSIISSQLIPYFQDRSIKCIANDDCQCFANALCVFSKSYMSSIIKKLRKIFSKAQKDNVIKFNPAEDIVLPKSVAKKTPRRSLYDEERHYLLSATKDSILGYMIITMLYTGLRPIEIQNVSWDWIDFKKVALTVKKSKSQAGTNRVIPLIQPVVTALNELYIINADSQYVFWINHKKKWNQQNFYENFHRYIQLIENKYKYHFSDDFCPYLLRHTFCTDCQAAGVPINVAKEFMGHSDIYITAKIYTHTVDEVFEMNRKKYNKYLGNHSL